MAEAGESKVISFVIEFTLAAEAKAEDLTAFVKDVVASAQSEEGTLGYEWFFSEDKRTVAINERYASSEALLHHLMVFGEIFAGRMQSLGEVTRLTLLGNASEAVLQAMAAFKPSVYPQRIDGFHR